LLGSRVSKASWPTKPGHCITFGARPQSFESSGWCYMKDVKASLSREDGTHLLQKIYCFVPALESRAEREQRILYQPATSMELRARQ
jgi:hypothetical protein